jgi:hypothetical protein
VSGRVLLAGGTTWAVSVAAKVAATKGASAWIRRLHSPGAMACAYGVISAGAELGLAATVLARKRYTTREVVAFGVGASTAEILYLLTKPLISPDQEDDQERIRAWAAAATKSPIVRYMIAIERADALLTHVGARGLVQVGMTRRNPTLVVAAMTAFSLVDGMATRGALSGWNWFDPKTCRRFFALLFIIGIAQVVTFGIVSRDRPSIGPHPARS